MARGGPRLIEVTVVIPCRDERGTLEACLDAIDAQDLPRDRFELLIVDGGSSDGSEELARARGANVLRDPGSGPAAARNVGIAHARGRIVAFTDADCRPRFDWLTRLVDAFEAAPDVGGVAGALRLPRESLLGRMEDNDARLHYRGYITANIAYRRDVLERVGGFDDSLVCAEDYDLAWRVLDAGHRIEHEPRAVVLHDPPELRGPLAGYLRKQFWYARADVPAHTRALARAWGRGRGATGSTRALAVAMDAVHGSAWIGALGVGLARRSPLALGTVLAGVALSAARRVAHTVADIGEGDAEVMPMIGVTAAKSLARGAGTLAGVAQLARPATWRVLSAPAGPALEPASSGSASPSRARSPA